MCSIQITKMIVFYLNFKKSLVNINFVKNVNVNLLYKTKFQKRLIVKVSLKFSNTYTLVL